MDSQDRQARTDKGHMWTWLGASIAWVVVLWGFGLWRWRGSPPSPNELGDFMAGVFAPVAFLWLVLGYRQQGEELRAQAEELRRSVEQQEVLATATAASLDFERAEARRRSREQLESEQPVPDIQIASSTDVTDEEKIRCDVVVTNYGMSCYDFGIVVEDDWLDLQGGLLGRKMLQGDVAQFSLAVSWTGSKPLAISYIDGRGRRQIQLADVVVLGGDLGPRFVRVRAPVFQLPSHLVEANVAEGDPPGNPAPT